MKRKGEHLEPEVLKKSNSNGANKKSMKIKEKLHKYHVYDVFVNGEKVSQRSIKKMYKFQLKQLPSGSLIYNTPRPSKSGELKYIISDMSDRSVLNIQGYGGLLDHIVECTERRRHSRWAILRYGLEVDNFMMSKRRGRPKKQNDFGFYVTLASSRAKYYSRLARPISKLDVERYFASIMGMGIRKYSSVDSYFNYNQDHLGLFISLIFRLRFYKGHIIQTCFSTYIHVS
jgi:hypothetical protein